MNISNMNARFIKQRLRTLETLILIYSDRDRERLIKLDAEKRELERELLDIMVQDTSI